MLLEETMLAINEASNGQTVELSTGQVMELRLAENPATGFRWHVSSPGDPACHIVSDAYEQPPSPGKPGAGGTHVWQVQAVRPGLCNLGLSYARSWDTGATSARSFSVQIRVSQK